MISNKERRKRMRALGCSWRSMSGALAPRGPPSPPKPEPDLEPVRKVRKLNDEQQRVVDLPLRTGRVYYIEAGPGSGKSTTMNALALRRASEGKRVILIYFNTAMAAKARADIGENSNVTVCTFHSLVSAHFETHPDWLCTPVLSSNLKEVAKMVRAYSSDTYKELIECCLSYRPGFDPFEDADESTKRLFADIMDKKFKLPMTVAEYLYARAQPVLDADDVYHDEAQDMNSAALSIITHQRHTSAVVLCGDARQAIYQFRQNIDFNKWLEDCPDLTVIRMQMPSTYRFGPRIAQLASSIHRHTPARGDVVAATTRDSNVFTYDSREFARDCACRCTRVPLAGGAVVARFNRTLFDSMLRMLTCPCKLDPRLGADENTMDECMGELASYCEGPSAWLARCSLYKRVGLPASTAVRFVEWLHEKGRAKMALAKLRWLSDYRERSDAPWPRVHFVTVHGSKGLEWPTVVLAPDLKPVQTHTRGEALNVLYVALTRAISTLSVPSTWETELAVSRQDMPLHKYIGGGGQARKLSRAKAAEKADTVK